MHNSEYSLEISLCGFVFVNEEIVAAHCIPRNCFLGVNINLNTHTH